MDRTPSYRSDAANVARGILMGGADIIPGVSGGTVALILGIYERLVTAISRFDVQLLRHLSGRRWRDAAAYVDLRFLVTLAGGILTGVAALSTLIHYLLHDHHQYTLAAFFGLILVSSVLVGRMVAPKTPWQTLAALGLGAAAACFAYWMVGQPSMDQPPPGNGYLFLCGMIAICAMILPGISGAFILIMLGKYADVLAVVRDLASLNFTTENITTIVVFASGCVVGLLCFSKVLRWLLNHFHAATMAILCGFMIGSLRKIWPFQTDLDPSLPLKEKTYQSYMPDSLNADVVVTLGIAIAAMVGLWLVDRSIRSHQSPEPSSNA